MKICPHCLARYEDEMNFCLQDGAALVEGERLTAPTESYDRAVTESVVQQATAASSRQAFGESQRPSVPKMISGGVVNGKARNLVKPVYPPAARAVNASGAVNVQVTIDEEGNVISATAVSGHPLLRASAVQAARASKFSPTMLQGAPVKVSGVIVYNFVAP